jgi:ribonuclease P protein component
MRRLHLSRLDFNAASKDRTAKRGASLHFSIVISQAGAGTAVVVSKKVAKSSVERHLIKRRVREAVAAISNSVPKASVSHGTHATIVYAKAGSGALPYSEITTELNALLLPLLQPRAK